MGWEAPWHWVVLAVIVIALFGYKKLPDAARSLGRSLRIFKTEIKGMNDDDAARAAAKAVTAAPPVAVAPPVTAAPVSAPAVTVPVTAAPVAEPVGPATPVVAPASAPVNDTPAV